MDAIPSHKKIPSSCITNVNAFFHLPNPKIFHLFIISATANFSIGTAMIIEWFYHGQYHPGYRWIIYFAPLVIVFPLLMLIICLVSANLFAQKDQSKHDSPVADRSNSEKNKHDSPVIDRSSSNQSSENKRIKRLKIQDGEVEFELYEISSEEEEAIVQVGEERRIVKDVNLGLKRSVSCKFSRAGPDKKSIMKRWMSF